MHFVKAKGILSAKNGMNLYRGCTHGCIYCDSRSNCYHMKHAFEDIEVKENAIDLLEYALIRTYGNQYMIESGNSKNLMRLFHRKCEGTGIMHDNEQIFNYLHFFEEKNDSRQLSIWDWKADKI